MTTNNDFYRLRVFSIDDVIRELGMTHSAAAASLVRWQKKSVVRMIRRGMYVTVDPSTGASSADKYEICSKINSASYVGWHTAFEFHGVAHQPFYNAYVGSDVRFSKFNFEQIDYEYCKNPLSCEGIITPIGNPNVRVTDIERTIIDCCDRIDRAGGAEELMHCIEGVILLDENKLMRYLELYDKSFLYQKAGYVLEQNSERIGLSNELIEECRRRGAKYTQSMTEIDGDTEYVSSWKLYVPKIIINTDDYDFV